MGWVASLRVAWESASNLTKCAAAAAVAVSLGTTMYWRATTHVRRDGVSPLPEEEDGEACVWGGSGKLIALGTTRVNPGGVRARPRLWIWPTSLNSAKAHMCLRLSSVWTMAEVVFVDIFGENYTLDYARVNPNMTVPVLEIGGSIITDSRLIASYLMDHHPGRGDKSLAVGLRGRSRSAQARLQEFLDLVSSFDEALYSYGHGGEQGGVLGGVVIPLLHRLRLARLRQSHIRAAGQRDRGPLQAAFERKIAMMENFAATTATAQDTVAMAANDARLDAIFDAANKLLEESGGPYLFGGCPCSADAFLAPIIARLGDMFGATLRDACRRFGQLEAYTATLKGRCNEAHVVFGFGAAFNAGAMVRSMLPVQLLLAGLGIIRAPRLPDAVEERIHSIRSARGRWTGDTAAAVPAGTSPCKEEESGGDGPIEGKAAERITANEGKVAGHTHLPH